MTTIIIIIIIMLVINFMIIIINIFELICHMLAKTQMQLYIIYNSHVLQTLQLQLHVYYKINNNDKIIICSALAPTYSIILNTEY